MYSKIYDEIKRHSTIIIHRHSRPDGDALGSQLGFREALKDNYPNKEIYAVGDSSERLGFMGDLDIIEDSKYEKAIVFVLDTPEEAMINDIRYKMGKTLIKIDHHIPRNSFGDIEVIDTSFESCASLVSDILLSNKNIKLSKSAAQNLFTGIITDSGRFRYDSVTPKTFQIAAKLLETNFSMGDIYSKLYIEDLKIVRLRSVFTLKFKTTKNNVAYIMTSKEEIKEYDLDFFTLSRGMVNTMSGIRGIDIWVNFTEDESNNVVIAEIRSNKYNINQIAAKYGGGGHLLASGASLKNFEEAKQMLEDLDALIEVGLNE